MPSLRRGAVTDEPVPASDATRHPMFGGRVTWVRVAPRRSVLVADDRVVGVIHNLALAAPPPGAPDHVLVRPSLGTVELVMEGELSGDRAGDLRRAVGPAVEFERDLLAWILVAPDERTLPRRAIVLSTTADPVLVSATAGFSRATLPGDGEHRPPRSIEGVYHDSTVHGTHITRVAQIADTLADHTHRFVTIDAARDGVAALVAIEDAIVEGDLLIVVMRDTDGSYLVRARVDGRRAGYDLAPPATWARIWSTVSYRVVQLSMQQIPLLDELGDPLYIEEGFVDLLDRPENDARRLLLERIDRRLHGMEENAHYAERLIKPFELACRRAGDAVHVALCHGLRGRLAELDYRQPDAIASHRACIVAVSEVCADDDPAMTRALVGLGAALHRREDVEAIAVLLDAVARMRRRGDGDTLALGSALETLGRAQRRHKQNDDAVRTLREGFRVQRSAGARWPEHCLYEAELALEADGRFTEALAVIDELRAATTDEYQNRTLDEAEARCRIGLGELATAAALLVAVRRETYMTVDQRRIDALLAKLPAEIRETRIRAAADAEQTARDQVAAAEAPLRDEARARGLVLIQMMLSTRTVYLYVAPCDETDGPARAAYRARCNELVALALARVVAVPVDVQIHHFDHRAGRMFEARAGVERVVREVLATGLEGYGDDDPWARVELIEVSYRWTALDLVLGVHGPAGLWAASDFGFELIARVRETHRELADLPMESMAMRVFAGTGTYPYDGCNLSAEATALLEELRRLPRRAEVDIELLESARSLSDDVRAVVHTFALHAVENETVGEALYFDADAVESCRTSYASVFVLAYDMREPTRTLVVERERGRTRSVQWWPGIWSPDEVHQETDDEYGSLATALKDIVDSRAVMVAIDALRSALEREKARAAVRARRFGERGWVGWFAQKEYEDSEKIDDLTIHNVAGDWTIDFTVEPDRDRVWRVDPDGVRTEVALPSPAPYRVLSSLTPDRTRLIVASHTRVREVAVETGATRIVMEGPWVVSVAALAEDLVVFASFGGEHTLDRRDPDVAALSSIRQLPPGDSVRLAAANGLGVCRIGDEPGYVRWIDVEDRDQLHLVPLFEGRILVISSWSRALIVAIKDGAFIPLRSIDRGWGPSVQLFGLEAAWQAARPYQVAKLSLSRGQDVPAPRRFLVACDDERLFFERVDVAPAAHDIPGWARRALALTEADLLWDRSSTGAFVLIRDNRLRLVRLDGDEVVERAVEPSIEGEHAAFSDAADRMVLAGPSGAWWIDRERATATPIAPPQAAPVASIAALSAERVLVLSRVGPVDVRLTLLVDGNVLASWPVHVFDQIHALPRAGLIALSFQYMPEDKAMMVLLHVSARGTLHHVANARIGVRDVFERDNQVFVESSDGVFALHGLESIGALDGNAALASIFYDLPSFAGAVPSLRTSAKART